MLANLKTCLPCFSLIFIAVIVTPVFSNELPFSVQQKLKKVGVPKSAVGIYVKEIGAANPIVAINAHTAMNPASVMKLVTTFAGLELLGPAYTWRTELYKRGEINGDVLHGDLVIKGYGDPKLNLENFWLLTYYLRQTGLRKITGDLVLDHTFYNVPEGDPGEFDGQPYRAYNILPEALLVNYRTSSLHLEPQKDNNAVQITLDPLPGSLQLRNNLKLTGGRCGDWRSRLDIEMHANKASVHRPLAVLNGRYSINCGKKTYLLGLHDSSSYTRDLFKRLWIQQGGEFDGDVLAGEVPKGIMPFKVYQSPPLTEIIRGINKFSNNIAARQLYLTLGTANDTPTTHNSASATLLKSDIAIKRWLSSQQLHFSELIVENGSGLSRKERISAQHMGELLLRAFKSPVMPEFISSLPIAAVDGTMKKRLQGTPMQGMAHIKTGTLNSVKAMAGYMLDKLGRRVIVVFFINHAKANRAEGAMDALLQWVYER